MKNRKTLWADLLLVGALLLSALLLRLWLRPAETAGGVAVVRVNGVETGRHPLSEDGRFPLNGGSNLLVIEQGRAHIEEADCPDKLCVAQGEIWREGEVLCCLPNRLTVRIEQGGEAPVDAVTG